VPFPCGNWVPSNTMWPGPRPTSVSGGILIHATVWPQIYQRYETNRQRSDSDSIGRTIFGRPFVLCYQTVCRICLSVCLSVCDVGVLWPNGWMDQDETWRAGKPRPRPHRVRWGPSSPKKGHSTPTFRPMSVVIRRLERSRCHLVGR